MSRQLRLRMAALVGGGLLLGAPLLSNGTANAGQADRGGRQVVFAGGGVLGFSCRARPEVGSLTVPAESTVRLVNRSGHRAQLRLGGEAKGTIPADGSAQVVFRRGTTEVSLDPDCPLPQESSSMQVTASPSAGPSGTPNPIPVPPSQSAPPTGPSTGTPTTSAPRPTTARPTTARPTTARPTTARPTTARPTTARPTTTRPQRPTASATRTPRGPVPAPVRPRTVPPATADAARSLPPDPTSVRSPSPDAQDTTMAAPLGAGLPPGDRRTVSLSAGAVPPVTPALPPAVSPDPVAPAAEPVSAMQPVSQERPLGLLALAAVICVAGASAGLIRAFVSQRASRAAIA